MYSCSPFVDDSVIVKGNLPEMLHCSLKVHIFSVLLRKAWYCVISESSITYMVLYSIYLSVLVLFVLFLFACLQMLWNDYTQHGALFRLKNEGTHCQKGNRMPHITSYSNIKCLFYSTLYCSALWIPCCNYDEEINIKILHSSSNFLMCFFFHSLDTALSQA